MIYPFICLFPSISLSVSGYQYLLSVYLPLHLSLFIDLSLYLSLYLLICVFVYLFSLRLSSLYLFIYRSIPPSIYLSALVPQVGPCINIQSTSDLALAESGSASGRCEWGVPGSYGRGSLAGGYLGMSRSPSCLSVRQLDPTRKVKSAVDLVSLVMQEKMASNMHIVTNV